MRTLHLRLVAPLVAASLLGACGPALEQETLPPAPTAEGAFGTDQSALADLEVDYAAEPGILEQNSATSCGDINWLGVYNFEEYGDKIWLKDGEKDGQSLGVHWRLGDGSRRGICINNGGTGNLRRCDKNFVEGKVIEFRMGRCDSGCSSLDNWTNWSAWISCRT